MYNCAELKKNQNKNKPEEYSDKEYLTKKNSSNMHRSYSDVMLPRGSRKEWRQRFSFRQKSLKSDGQVSPIFFNHYYFFIDCGISLAVVVA